MPPQIHHPVDQHNHILTLLPTPVYPPGVFTCAACATQGSGFSYRCCAASCNPHLQITCASMPLTRTHPSQHHLLHLTFSPPYPNRSFSCNICGNLGSNRWLYRCHSCEFDAHLSCTLNRPVAPVSTPLQQPLKQSYSTLPAQSPEAQNYKSPPQFPQARPYYPNQTHTTQRYQTDPMASATTRFQGVPCTFQSPTPTNPCINGAGQPVGIQRNGQANALNHVLQGLFGGGQNFGQTVRGLLGGGGNADCGGGGGNGFGCGMGDFGGDGGTAGYYNVNRKVVQEYLGWNAKEATQEDEIFAHALKGVDKTLLGELGVGEEGLNASKEAETQTETPVCDRCHNLTHHRVGSPIHHPTVDSLQQTIAESPHRRNHIYHVIDAADFPLSIVPGLQSSLRIPKLRTQNRRAKHKGWVAHDRIAEISFIVTRADLLAPKKEQVDVLMPYIKDVLRDALGRENKLARLGNVRLVSAKRGWWTKQIKEDIWERGGAGWMVGKVNVGKSNLFEAVFPKGRGADYQEIRKIRSAAEREEMLNSAKSLEDLARVQQELAEEDAETKRLANKTPEHVHQSPDELESALKEEEEDLEEDPDALLPPPQPYTPYPVLPIASSLPGTTASPIRIPFGKNRGELVDLPGLARTTPGLETFVLPTSHNDLVMTSRLNADRYVLKPGQSLILGGGLIRFTPNLEGSDRDQVFIIHPFVPIHSHITRTDKAIDYQSQTSDRQLQVPSILAPNAGPKMKSAGKFQLRWDATKALAGPVTSSVAGKMKVENLPFRIWSTDILIEGVGWVEVSCQTRRPAGWKPVGMVKKDPNHLRKIKEERQRAEAERKERKFNPNYKDDQFAEREVEDGNEEGEGDEMAEWQTAYPEIEVFSPLGKFVGHRRPMCASTTSGPKQVAARDRKVRPRRSMVSVKRQRKPGHES